MVFTQLDPSEKTAFFSLLDEYFTSRPHLLQSNGSDGNDLSLNSTAQARASATRAVASAFGVTSNATPSTKAPPPGPPARSKPPPPPARSPDPAESTDEPDDSAPMSVSGRVAAAAAMFGSNPSALGGMGSGGAPPRRPPSIASPPPAAPAAPPLPRRQGSATSSSSLAPPTTPGAPPKLPARRPSQNTPEPSEYDEDDRSSLGVPEHPGMTRQSSLQSLQSVRKFGDVDTTSGKGFYSSIKSGTVNKSKKPPSVAPPIPSAFAPRKNTWGPPPVRSGSAASGDDDAGQAAPPPPALPGRKGMVRTPEPEPEEEEEEWAETLYAYESTEPGDLPVGEGQRVRVVAHTSPDWWECELNGRSGLVPASYLQPA